MNYTKKYLYPTKKLKAKKLNKFAIGLLILLIGIIFLRITSISFANTLYYNSLTASLDGWQALAESGSYSFSSAGLKDTNGDVFGYSTSLPSLVCVATDIKNSTVGSSHAVVGMTDVAYDGVSNNYGHAIFLDSQGYNGSNDPITLEQTTVTVFNTGVNTPIDGQYHNYMLCRSGATYTAYLDQVQIYSKTFNSDYSNSTYPVIFGGTNDYLKNFYAYDSNPLTATPTPTVSPSLVVAINAGGNLQEHFVMDADFNGGQTYSSTATVDTSNVSNPAPQSVYQSVRYGNFTYTIPNLTANGNYTVKLNFNELYWGTSLASGGIGSRVFNVLVNGKNALRNYDIYQEAGGANKAVIEAFTATSDANGVITIVFHSLTDNAMINGIEISQ